MKFLEKQEISCQENTNVDKKRCHKRGLIPGPQESFASFAKRVNQTAFHVNPAPFPFDLQPDWVPIGRDSSHLFPWEGAATWIETLADGRRLCSIQIKPSTLFSCLYREDEVLSHELVHAIRLHFDEPRFEEILAFQTASSSWRRYWGPLFSRPCEALSWVCLVFLNWFGWILGIFMDHPEWGLYTLSFPLSGLLFVSIRLVRSQSVFSKALLTIQKIVTDPQRSVTAMLYFTDKEIQAFAHDSKEEVLLYIDVQRQLSPRLAQFADNYLIKPLSMSPSMNALDITPTTSLKRGCNMQR